MNEQLPAAEAIWKALEDVKDPEIPVVSVVDMGIVRKVTVQDGRVRVTMTPTFSGCPALAVMERDIAARIRQMGIDDVDVKVVLSPPWTSEWITDDAREKLRQFGIAPPARHGGNIVQTFFDDVACPQCGSTNTILSSSFGSTLCRTMYRCRDCLESFEQFKAL